MSKIGKLPIKIEEGVSLDLKERELAIKGPKGELNLVMPPSLSLDIQGDQVKVIPRNPQENKNLWGLYRVLIYNMIEGVSKGFAKTLEIKGVGYRASIQDQDLILTLGFSHPVKMSPLPGIEFTVEKNKIVISGIDKQAVGEMAARIRNLRPPEPYKGKGIKYAGEVILRKAGKAAKGK